MVEKLQTISVLRNDWVRLISRLLMKHYTKLYHMIDWWKYVIAVPRPIQWYCIYRALKCYILRYLSQVREHMLHLDLIQNNGFSTKPTNAPFTTINPAALNIGSGCLTSKLKTIGCHYSYMPLLQLLCGKDATVVWAWRSNSMTHLGS